MHGEFKKGGKVFEMYQKLYVFHRENAYPETDEDWVKLVKDFGQFTNRLEVRLAIQILEQIENDYCKRRRELDD